MRYVILSDAFNKDVIIIIIISSSSNNSQLKQEYTLYAR